MSLHTGFCDRTRKAIFKRNYDTMDEIKATLKKLENQFRAEIEYGPHRGSRGGGSGTMESFAFERRTGAEIGGNRGRRGYNGYYGFGRRGRYRGSYFGIDLRKIGRRCLKCYEEGHKARDCPKKQLLCPQCGKSGHVKEVCWNNPSSPCYRPRGTPNVQGNGNTVNNDINNNNLNSTPNSSSSNSYILHSSSNSEKPSVTQHTMNPSITTQQNHQSSLDINTHKDHSLNSKDGKTEDISTNKEKIATKSLPTESKEKFIKLRKILFERFQIKQ